MQVANNPQDRETMKWQRNWSTYCLRVRKEADASLETDKYYTHRDSFGHRPSADPSQVLPTCMSRT